MSDQDRALSLAERVLKAAGSADQAQATVSLSNDAYARFAQNYVVQNLAANATEVGLTYYIGKKSGSVTTADASDDGIALLVSQARAIAQRVPADNSFVSLPKAGRLAAPVRSFFDSTAQATPAERVGKLQPVFARMRESQLTASGFTTTQTGTLAIANSLGLRAVHSETQGGLQIKAMAAATSGYGQSYELDYSKLDPVDVARRAASKATVSTKPAALAPGRYTVVLETSAFQSLLKALIEGVNVRSVLDDKDSWMIDRIGKPIFAPSFTMRTDWSDPRIANPPFDRRDGAPMERFAVIDHGVPKRFFAGTYYANKFSVPATGSTKSIIVEAGTKSYDELVASVERGVLISRTWYERVIDPREAVITGSTRDGVYLIENGKLSKALRNFRFTVSMVEMMKNVEFSNVSRLAEPELDLNIQCVLPDAKLENFHLTAQTSYA